MLTLEELVASLESHLNDAEVTLMHVEGAAELSSLYQSGVALEDSSLERLSATLNVNVVSIESLGEAVKALYTRFLDALVKGWDFMVKYVDNVNIQLYQLTNAVEELSDLAEGRVATVAAKSQFSVDSNQSVLTHEFKPLDPKEYIQKLSEHSATLENVLLEFVAEVMNSSKFIAPLIESLALTDTSKESSLEKVKLDSRGIAKFGNEVVEHIVRFKGVDVSASRTDLQRGNGHVIQMTSLLGNKGLFVRYDNVDKASLRGEGIPFFNAFNAVFSAGVILDNISTEKTLPSNLEFTTLTPDYVKVIGEELSKNLAVLRRFRNRHADTLKQQRKRYQQLRAKLNSVSAVGDNTEVNLYLRRVGQAAMGLSRWYYDPFVPLVAHTLKIIRGSIGYCDASLKQWPKR